MNRRVCAGIRLSLWLPGVALIGACQGTPANIPADPAERVSNGDRVQVIRELIVPARKASILLQNGRIVSGTAVDRFDASCRFVMKAIKSTAQTIEPGMFRVDNVRYWEDFVIPDIRSLPFSGGEMINYEVTLKLSSERQSGIHSLVCKHDDDQNDGRHLNVSEMQQALGEYAQIIKPE